MAAPTIASRLQRRFITMSSDQKLLAHLHDELPEGWEMTTTLSLDDLGGFQDVLQYRSSCWIWMTTRPSIRSMSSARFGWN